MKRQKVYQNIFIHGYLDRISDDHKMNMNKALVRYYRFKLIKNSCDFQPQNTNQIFHMADMLFYARSIGNIDAPNKGLERVCSRASCDTRIPVHLAVIYTSAFSNVLLVLALNFMVHKSTYCKCSLAWCQVRSFLLCKIQKKFPSK